MGTGGEIEELRLRMTAADRAGFALCALIGGFLAWLFLSLLNISPSFCTESDLPCLRDWVGAFGGWAGAAIAIPSWLILRRQAADTRIQTAQSRFAPLQARATELREEIDAVGDIKASLSEITATYLWSLFGVNRDDFGRFYTESSTEISKTRDICSAAIDKVNSILIANPNDRLFSDRQNVMRALANCISDLDSVQRDLRKANRDQVILEEDGAARINKLAERIAETLEIDMVLRFIQEWRLATAEQLSGVQREVDRILGIQ